MNRDNLGRYTTTTKYIAGKAVGVMASKHTLALLTGGLIVAGIIAFNMMYELQNPIMLRKPWKVKEQEYINPVVAIDLTPESTASKEHKGQLEQLKVKSVQELIVRYAIEYNVDPVLALDIARCESGYRYNASNSTSTAEGIYQFIDGTWIGTRNAMGLDSDLSLKMNAEQNIITAMWKIQHGGVGAWDASKHCWSH